MGLGSCSHKGRRNSCRRLPVRSWHGSWKQGATVSNKYFTGKSCCRRIGARSQGSTSPVKIVDKKVRTLRKLVPNTESVGLVGLFTETADYIKSLQMRLKAMQLMVNVLSAASDH
ncbi:hypothetical protein U1Q18_019922 [Sarracenia purpurea var. burkii]